MPGPGPSLADDARVSARSSTRVGDENLGFTFLDVARVARAASSR